MQRRKSLVYQAESLLFFHSGEVLIKELKSSQIVSAVPMEKSEWPLGLPYCAEHEKACTSGDTQKGLGYQ
jgi:hypothetical protein